MTDSRETVRRRQFRDRTAAMMPPTVTHGVALTDLCVIQGCLNLRVGANLCHTHEEESGS